MKTLARVLVVLELCLAFPLASAGDAPIRIKGSDTIGGRAMPEIAEEYGRSRAGRRVVVEALGSATAFVGLFDGSADIGESSRPINEAEKTTALQLGLKLHEVVIGYDGVAVVVHPDNPVKELSVAQISELFSGKIMNWSDLGGFAGRVRRISRPTYSGTYTFFKEKVLRRGNAKGPEEFAPATEYVEENDEILRAVASDPLAVSYVGLGWLSPAVRAVPIVARPGEAALLPSIETVRTGRYPLYRPLLMYVPSTARPEVLDFVRFVLSADGSAMVRRSGFIPSDASVPPEFLSAPSNSVVAGKGTEIIRIPFAFGRVSVGAGAMATLDKIAERLKREGQVARVTGHADTKGKNEANRSVSLARANAVAYRLLQDGVPVRQIQVQDAGGADAPVASNVSAEGRARNRRVDIVLTPR